MSASRSIDNFQTLTNTNLGIEASRAVDAEHAIQVNLTAYSTSNDAAVAVVSALAHSNYSTIGAQITVVNASIASIQVTQALDEGHSAAEVSRAQAAESALTVSVASEITRAQAAEAVNTAGIASNVTAIASNATSIASLNASRTTDEAHIATNTASIVAIQATQVTDESHITGLQTAFTAFSASVNTSTANVAGVLIAGQINTGTITCTGPMVLTSAGDQWGRVAVHIDNTSSSNGVRIDTIGSQVNVADLVLNRNNGYMILRNDSSCVDSNNSAGGEFKLYNQATGVFSDANGYGLMAYYGLSSSGVYNGDFHVRSGSLIASTSVNVPLVQSDTGALTLTSTHAQYGTSTLSLTNVDGNDGLTLDNTLSTAGVDLATFSMRTISGLVKTVYEKRAAHMFDSANAADGEYRIEGMHGTNFYSGTASSAIAQGNFSVPHGSITALGSITGTAVVAPSYTTASDTLTLTASGGTNGSTSVVISNNDYNYGMIIDNSAGHLPQTALTFKTKDNSMVMHYDFNPVVSGYYGGDGNHAAGEMSIRTTCAQSSTILFVGEANTGLAQGNFNVMHGSVTAQSLVTNSISTVGPLTLSSTGDQYGSSTLVLENVSGIDGMRLDTTGSTFDLVDIRMKSSTGQGTIRYEKRVGQLCNALNSDKGEMTSYVQGAAEQKVLYLGEFNSGLLTGSFNVPAGVITDINDQDVTLVGSWSNFSNTSACQANMRLVRKGSVVTVSLASFIDTAQSSAAISTYSLAIPAWAYPPALVECSIVVATSGMRSAGCCLLSPGSPHNFSILPFNANWGSSGSVGGGLNQATCFSYLV